MVTKDSTQAPEINNKTGPDVLEAEIATMACSDFEKRKPAGDQSAGSFSGYPLPHCRHANARHKAIVRF